MDHRAPTPAVELGCGAGLAAARTCPFYREVERHWERRLTVELGHSNYLVRWHPVWACFAIYRHIQADERARLRIEHGRVVAFRFAVRDELGRACRIDDRLLAACRDDDLMWRDPWRHARMKMREEAAVDRADDAEHDDFVDAFVRDSEEHIHITSGRRGWHGYGSTGDGVSTSGASHKRAPPAIFSPVGSRTVISARGPHGS